MHAAILLISTLLMSTAPDKPPEIVLEQQYPTVGKATTIVLPQVVDKVKITYRPDARAVETTEEIPGGGTEHVVWRPLHAGIVKIEAGGLTKKVSVRFDGLPMSGLLILLIAGAILFGGAAWSLRQLLRD